MANKQLLDYVKTELEVGKSRQAIEHMLVDNGGWSAADVSEVFNMAEKPEIKNSVTEPVAPVHPVQTTQPLQNVQSVPPVPEVKDSHKARFALMVIAASVMTAIVVAGLIIWAMSSVFFDALNSAKDKAQASRISANMMQIKSYMEFYYSENGDSYSEAASCDEGPFASGTGKLLISGLNKSPLCYASQKSYAISTMLDSQNSFCVDGTGYAGGGFAIINGSQAECAKRPLGQ